MGASQDYRRSSYSGKESTSISESTTRRTSQAKSKSSMMEMLELLEEVERCRDVVTSRQADLDSAKKDLEKAEQKVSAQINTLDSETKARLIRMMGGLDENEKGQVNLNKSQDDFER